MRKGIRQPVENDRDDLGRLIAKILAGSWRENCRPIDFSEAEVARIAPLLDQTGDAALAWWRIRDSALATTPIGQRLHDSYRHLRLAARVHEREIKYVLALLRAEGIEPVLVKGWAIARRYPDSSLRPYGDLDLCIRPDQFAKAEAALECLATVEGHYVDLHDGFAKLEGRRQWHGRLARGSDHGQDAHATWDELFNRSQLVDLGDEKIRVLSDEDHLRVLCLHLLRSGAWRPLWLCDVALLLETRAPDFDWDICTGSDRRQADSVACTVGLAQQLLGAEGEGQRAKSEEQRATSSGHFRFAPGALPFAAALPRWLVPAVLRQWNRCANPDAVGTALPTLLAKLTEPKKLFREIHARWDNPVRSTVALCGRFNSCPRLPYQLAELITHSPEVPKQLRTLLTGRPASLKPNAAALRPLTSDL